MNIAVIGPGGIGCLFSALLAEAGHDVCLIDRRPDRAALISREGLIIESEAPCGTESAGHIFDLRNSADLPSPAIAGFAKAGAKPLAAKASNGDLRTVCLCAHAFPADIGPVELIILCVKAHETAGTMPSVIALSAPQTKVISLQNGLGNLEAIKRVVAGDNLFAGVTTHGATVIGLNHVRHAGAGSTNIGSINDNNEGADSLAKMFSKAGIASSAEKNTTGLLWSKLIINAAICPVSVLANLPNGQIAENDKWRSLLCKAAEEGGKIAAAKGIKLTFADPVRAVLEVCEKTSQNISSMLQDIRRGRQTEIMEINGAVLRAAAELGLDAPTNAMLCESVVEIETRLKIIAVSTMRS